MGSSTPRWPRHNCQECRLAVLDVDFDRSLSVDSQVLFQFSFETGEVGVDPTGEIVNAEVKVSRR